MRFPKDAEIEEKIRDAQVDNVVATMLSAVGHYEARRGLAEFIMTLRKHVMTRDNVQILPGGMEGRCDRCGMKILVPVKPRPGEDPIHGRAAELNCPEARRSKVAEGYADMPLHLYEKFLFSTGLEDGKPRPTSFDPAPDISEALRKAKEEEEEAARRFEAKNGHLLSKIR